jgi:hypothetical protein
MAFAASACGPLATLPGHEYRDAAIRRTAALRVGH